MADITRWDPFAEMTSLRHALDRMFDDRPIRLFPAFGGGEQGYFPVDLLDTKEAIVVKASLPGVKPEDIDISVTGDVLTLKGESKEDQETKAENYYRRERRHGVYMRQFTLPGEVDAEHADAAFEDGVLTLRLPKAESVKPKTIKVNGARAIAAEATKR